MPNVVNLPNDRRFTTRHKRRTRNPTPDNVTLNRTYKQRVVPRNRRRQRQNGREIGSLIKKVIKNSIVRKLAKGALR